MEEGLMLPVTYKGEELSFPLRIVPQGYVYRFAVLIHDIEVIYERDDAGELRALIARPDEVLLPLPDTDLVMAVGEVLQSLTA